MRVVLFLAAITLSCSRQETRHSPPQPIAAQGAVQSLQIVNGDLHFCDSGGARHVDLNSGTASTDTRPCVSTEANTACSDIQPDISVRASMSEPRDTVDIGASSFPLPGRVHDCAGAGDYVAVGTGSAVILIDKAHNTTKEISSAGGDRVAINKDWIAWTDGPSIRFAPVPQASSRPAH